MGDKELSLIDKKITSLLEVALSPTVTSLNLHCNHIPRIEGLTSAWHLRHLDLSSNKISQIEGLSTLTSLRTLNLSCNLITKVEGLNGLVNLSRLNLSYNQINNITGLLHLHGREYKLKHISLQGNHLDSIDHLLQCLPGLQSLREVILSQYDSDNPVCRLSGYREIVMQSLPQISALDDLDRLGNPSHQGLLSPCDVPGLDDYVDLLLSSDTSHTEVVKGDGCLKNPHINNMLTRFNQPNVTEAVDNAVKQREHQSFQPFCSSFTNPAVPVNEERIKKLEQRVSQLIKKAPADDTSSSCTHAVVKGRRAKRDTDRTSESECDSGKENRRRSRIHKHPNSISSKVSLKETKDRRSDSDSENHKQRNSKVPIGAQGKASGAGSVKTAQPTRRAPFRSTKTSVDVKTKSTENEETYRTIVEERDQEKERRWKAEQAVRTLTEELKCLQTRMDEEKDIQNVALHATDRLKELLLKERSERSNLHIRVEELEGRCQSLTQQLDQACSKEEQHKGTMRRLEERISQGDAIRSRQQDEESRRHQELENKAAALKRELDIHRFSVQQYKDKLQQMHELLVSREEEHRKQLGVRLQPGGADFLDAVAKEVASAERRHAQREAELQEKVAEGRKQYAALEDEFRMALTIEAARFSEVKETCDRLTSELQDLKGVLIHSQQKEKKSGSLVQELTTMVKEQKKHISELIKCKKEAVTALKRRLLSLEAEVEQDRRLSLQLELLRKEKAQLLSKLTAQESVLDGLKEERKLWSQELAQQGVSLAQDRGRLEARIEVLSTELEDQKKQNERNTDALKIKSKIVDDQTETIRKLKEALQERDDQIRKIAEEAAQAQKKLQQQLEDQKAQQAELRAQWDHLSLRKEDLKQQLEDMHAELEEVKRAYRDSSKKWQEKADLLTLLESQVKRMKENFDEKEHRLLEERHKATEAHKAAVERLRSVDDAFHQQLESVQAAHQADLLQLAKQKQEEIERANHKVIEVEEEMRQLLEETQNSKKIMEEKMKRLTNVLKDF
ncbi:leucine-rich repeat and coiled-coil domain-containing protein 1 isoform X2 [Takifugu rubripes]|uniref:Leucine-rich repeat and coiled-coil domain-containing protein 1 n=1 Tax=Takifugu rubripes TaxID=31033 RepID=H2S556_TAKRU|nr:leucine-rich repeat and coiled-coil domain-containing protein 1 isoform X2 [Takifugu rubripes]|eukprot:XP_003975450.2 PREDICTED: leucine-rich repeat and coiled-coil domain-containing protein 1 isoform X1 [Takifugu rubripes]